MIIEINIYHGQCMNAHVLLCSMVYQPHSFPPSISSFIIEIAFAIIWATGTRLAFAMFRSGTTSVRTSEIGKYPDGILPQHGLWTMDYGLWTIWMGSIGKATESCQQINVWLLTSWVFNSFLSLDMAGRWYEYEIFIASCTDNIYDLENERWLLGDMIVKKKKKKYFKSWQVCMWLVGEVG